MPWSSAPGDRPIHCAYSWNTLEPDERVCVLVACRDITQRVRAKEELRRNCNAMVNRERLSAIGELALGIAHDLNNSLNALQLGIEPLGEQKIFA